MKANEMTPHVGKHVFLVIDGERSTACDVLKVTDDRVYAIETDCDHWPFKYVELPLDKVVYALGAEDVDHRVERDQMPADPDEFEILGGESRHMPFYSSPADLFGELRAWLNGEDELGRPLSEAKRKANKSGGVAS